MSRRLVVEADGGSRGNPGPAGFGAVVRDADTGEVLREVADGIGVATNNVAEYRGLIAGLEAAAELDPAEVEVRMDSKLVVEQMAGRWQVKHPDMRLLAAEAAALLRRLPRVTFRHVPRAQNAHADRLANEAMDAAAQGEQWAPQQPAERPRTGWMEPTAAPTVMWLLRHGETPLSVERRFSGLGDPELTDRGHEQAKAAAERVASIGDFAAVVSSPLRRAADTAAAAAAVLGVDVEIDEDLRETDFGRFEGLTFSEIRKTWPDQLAAWLADPDVAPPEGESFAATARRVRRARDRVVAAHPGERVLVVSHVTPIKTLVRIALDAPQSALYRLHLDLVGLSCVDWFADGRAVVRVFNDTSHLPPG